MNRVNLIVIVGVIIMFISLFLASFLITVKTEHKLSNRLFAAFLVLTTIDLGGVLFSFFNENPSNIGMFKNSITFLQLPAFYLYVLSVCYSDFNLKKRHLVHIVPFLIANLILLPRFYTVDLPSKVNFLKNSSNMLEIQFNHIFIHVQIITYIIAAFIFLRKTRKLYLENYTGGSIKSFNWLFQLTLALSLFYFIVLFKNVFKFSKYPNISEWLEVGIFIFELLIISWYLLKALNNPSLFRNIDSKLKLVKEIIFDKKNEHLTVNLATYDKDLFKLKSYMIEKKPFLNPSLTIQDVSNDIEIPTRELSLLINHRLGQHFFDFINTYRIENAKAILEDITKHKVTILEILYEVGFNSKSSFNAAFKKHAGITPTKYRKQLKNNTL